MLNAWLSHAADNRRFGLAQNWVAEKVFFFLIKLNVTPSLSGRRIGQLLGPIIVIRLAAGRSEKLSKLRVQISGSWQKNN